MVGRRPGNVKATLTLADGRVLWAWLIWGHQNTLTEGIGGAIVRNTKLI